MIAIRDIQTQINGFLQGETPLDIFEDWLFSNSWNIHIYAKPELVELVHKIQGCLTDFSVGAIGAQSLREELGNAIRPFVEVRQIANPLAALGHRSGFPNVDTATWSIVARQQSLED